MKKVIVSEKENGFVVAVAGFIHSHGEHVFKATELLPMVEFIGQLLTDAKVEVEYR